MYFTMDSFGAYCPNNWQEIVDALNDYAMACGVTGDNTDIDDRCARDIIWERWCAGDYSIAPEPIF